MQQITDQIKLAVNQLYALDLEPELTRPDPQFGDLTSNIALRLSAQLGKTSKEVAEAIKSQLVTTDLISRVEVAGPGFINIWLADHALLELAEVATNLSTPLSGKTVVVEYSDPNPFKSLHAGHLYTSIVGDSIANLYQQAGAVVHRVNFGGDVGLHVGKTMWSIIKRLNGEHPEKLNDISELNRSQWMSEAYIEGNSEYENNSLAKEQIIDLNKRIYLIHSSGDKQSPFAQIYWTCRAWSYDYFDNFYAKIGIKFEKYYPESQTTELGLQKVNEQLQLGVFKNSDGAVIFEGDKFGLHTRVFVNSQGLPTYEAKDVGLILAKWRDYHFDQSIVITSNEQQQYMEVVLKAIEQFEPQLVKASRHITHGTVKLSGGQKMSSRLGNTLSALDVIDAATQAAKNVSGSNTSDSQIVLGAVKYSFLKQGIGADIIYDPIESVSLSGNSGPYLLYALVRAKAILNKVTLAVKGQSVAIQLDQFERSLVQKIGEFTEIVSSATHELAPQLICTYLYELAQVFNRFYENSRIIDDPRQNFRLLMIKNYSNVLEKGLNILGISSVEQM